MEQSINEDNNDIEVQFIDDQSVIHIIKDETAQENTSKILTGTPKNRKDIVHKSAALINSKKSNRTSNDNSYDRKHSDNELNTILKPKALFVDGDVPGECMFSFNSKHRKSSTNQLSIPKTPASKKKMNTIIGIKQHNKSHQDDNTSNNKCIILVFNVY
uniref:Uncharacterized protein n=1 Tax=Sipha flava TaxID=143950 RepID=A0A2S2QWT3_9HEMI